MTYFEITQLMRSFMYGSIAILIFLNALRLDGMQQGFRMLFATLFLSLSIGGLLRVFVGQTAMDYWVSGVNTPLGLGILFMEIVVLLHSKSFGRRKEDVLAETKPILDALSRDVPVLTQNPHESNPKEREEA